MFGGDFLLAIIAAMAIFVLVILRKTSSQPASLSTLPSREQDASEPKAKGRVSAA